jgi:hypothetical protein
MNEQQQRALSAGLKALANSTRHAGAGAHVEALVLAEMRRVVGPQPARYAWVPIAAALLLTTGSAVWLATQAPPANPAVALMAPAGFVGVPGAAALPPIESASIVRVSLPVSALPSYGIHVVPDIRFDHTQADVVEADLLIAQDGVTRGIRLVPNSNMSRSTP